MSQDPSPPNVSCYSLDAHAHYIQAHIHTQTKHEPRGPVFPAGLRAFSLLSHHLHTNIVCWGPGTNMRHSTFHYWALIIGGWEVAGEPVEKGGDKEIEKEEGSKQDTGRDRVENDILFYFHHPQNPFWTHACTIEDIFQMQTWSVLTPSCHFAFALPLFPPSSPFFPHSCTLFNSLARPAWHITAKKPFWKV